MASRVNTWPECEDGLLGGFFDDQLLIASAFEGLEDLLARPLGDRGSERDREMTPDDCGALEDGARLYVALPEALEDDLLD